MFDAVVKGLVEALNKKDNHGVWCHEGGRLFVRHVESTVQPGVFYNDAFYIDELGPWLE